MSVKARKIVLFATKGLFICNKFNVICILGTIKEVTNMLLLRKPYTI